MKHRPLAALLMCAIATPAFAQATLPEPPPVKQELVAGPVHVLYGGGGNVGVSAGPDGVFVIDDQYAPMTPGLLGAIREFSDKPVKFVVNTHWHGDHTGGNENFGSAGAVIVAHDNVRVQMASTHFNDFFKNTTQASPGVALPVITFADAVTFHWNGEEIRVFHVAPAHTDGDSFIHFTKSNVLHLGDVFFSSFYPYFDNSTGGTIKGMVKAVDVALAIADDQTRIIPGHGPVVGKAELRTYRDMLATVIGRIELMIKSGKTLQQVLDTKPTADFDAKWGTSNFLPPNSWVTLVYADLVRK